MRISDWSSDVCSSDLRILDLYAGHWEGHPLGPTEYVLSADEKTSIQARLRRHPTQPPQPDRPMAVEHEYVRGGAWAYRSEERRVGKECVRTRRSRWSPCH